VDHPLELGECRPLRSVLDIAHPANGFETALVDGSSRHADIEERANGAFAHVSGGDARFQLGDPRLHQLAMQRHLCRLALRPRIRQVDAEPWDICREPTLSACR
jgi:hypothetical protein